MKNLKHILWLLCLVMLTLCLLTSCEEGLEAPKPVLNEDTQTLHWEKIKGAQSYTVKVSDGMEITVYEENYSLEYLAPGEYTIFVRANGDGEVVENSAFTKIPYRRYAESGLKYQLINDGKEYQLVGGGTATGDVVMEAIYRTKPVTAIADKALYNNQKITSLTVSENVRHIGEKAFAKCSQLKSVIIPDGVSAIGAYAFQSCKALERITLPNSVTEIAAHTFAWCSGLTDITVGNRLTNIGEYAFSNCEKLRKINYHGCTLDAYESYLPDSLLTVGSYAFTDCTGLYSIHLGEGLKALSLGAFMSCKSLCEVGFGEGLKRIGEMAFQYCESLESIAIPDSTEVIENGAFIHCIALNEIALGTGLVEIGHSVFFDTMIYNTTETDEGILVIDGWLIKAFKLPVNYTVPEGVYGVASYAASENDTVQQLNLRGVRYVGYAAFHASAKLFKATFDDSLITLGEAAFNSCPYLDAVIVGNSLQSIGDFAFYDCEKLSASGITLPDTLTTIGMQAFRNTKAYTDVTKTEKKGGVVYIGKWAVDFILPSSDPFSPIIVEEDTYGIANYTFANQSILQLIMPDSVEYIGRGAFYRCVCYSINLPANLKHIGDYAFYCASYTNFGGPTYDLVIPQGTLTIGRSAFYSCGLILSLTIPDSVVSIGDYAFYDCFNIGYTADLEIPTGEEDEEGEPITEIVTVTGYLTLSEGLKSIGIRAFQGTGLVEVVIPDSVTSLGAMAFYNCQDLQSITFGSSIQEISDHMFYGNESLQNVVVKGTLNTIGEAAFQGCVRLETVDLHGVIEIGKSAFRGCSALKEIALPDTLTTIGDYAFRGCVSVKSFFLPRSVSNVGMHAFYGLNGTTLYMENESIPSGFHRLFNSSFRPLILGCTSDSGAVATIQSGNIQNSLAVTGITDPLRKGYIFDGWVGADGSRYTSEALSQLKENIRLTATFRPAE